MATKVIFNIIKGEGQNYIQHLLLPQESGSSLWRIERCIWEHILKNIKSRFSWHIKSKILIAKNNNLNAFWVT